MLSRWRYDVPGNRDLRIDWLRGLAMTCVIVDHSGISSVFSWFTYERFWTVTAAEVFVLLSGVAVGSAYGRKLAHRGWRAVARSLARRTAVLYGASAFVALSILALSYLGADVGTLTAARGAAAGPACFVAPGAASIAADVVLMRCAPWPFQIIGLYVWLVALAVPALVALHRNHGRALLAASWGAYLLYRVVPIPITTGAFEQAFPLLTWQLLFVHGLAAGFHRERVASAVARCPRYLVCAAATAAAVFAVFALANPWNAGPAWLHCAFVSPDRFSDIYVRYFNLSSLGPGRLMNLAVALPLGYAALTRGWAVVRPAGLVFVTLGRHSLGAFALHVYTLPVLVRLGGGDLVRATLVHAGAIAAIAAVLALSDHVRSPRVRVRSSAAELTPA